MGSLAAHLKHYLLLVLGALVGNAVAVGAVARSGWDVPGFLGLARRIPALGPPALEPVLEHAAAAAVLTAPPAVGLVAVVYPYYRLVLE
ncbi:MAG: hypothetical protein ABEH40_03205 [Haloferacaceae archaeon]